MSECCANCRFWIPPPEGGSYPRQRIVDYVHPLELLPGANPPRYKTVPGSERCECRVSGPELEDCNYKGGQATWPQTRPEDWCGEWEAHKTAQQLYDETQGRGPPDDGTNFRPLVAGETVCVVPQGGGHYIRCVVVGKFDENNYNVQFGTRTQLAILPRKALIPLHKEAPRAEPE